VREQKYNGDLKVPLKKGGQRGLLIPLFTMLHGSSRERKKPCFFPLDGLRAERFHKLT